MQVGKSGIPWTSFPEARVISFGYKHGAPPAGGPLIIDLRPLFRRNPHRNPRLREKTGKDEAVAQYIMEDPEFWTTYMKLVDRVLRVLDQDPKGKVYVGCMGGRHRSVYVADRLGRELGIPVSHRDLKS